jgi:hypothetical protein
MVIGLALNDRLGWHEKHTRDKDSKLVIRYPKTVTKKKLITRATGNGAS